ncbi:hypothetical protein KOR42_41710 [Thalassoglobus neptunius]|uniref:CRISPR-associated exonuclease Cas4 n=1 Tax=Thalassoglobus neptunius TaxID=1938619 RepID=A0A5C5WAH1_9PLAN|nr:CRISPR-associated protein Cas4 [Thalassoglobus neptunius]TWT47059.1 hypothetical protein KOR42_41710 [Thalassoglobus neptunius]
MYSEDDLLPISALQHLLFCERQCALIHVERLWAENRFTAEGNHLHEKAHTGKPETRNGVRITCSLPLHSNTLGLVGQADVVEWEPPASQRISGKRLVDVLKAATPEDRQQWRVTPIEYKRGKPKQNNCDRVQLCAQAICLEEMLDVKIEQGELFYGSKRRRVTVNCDEALREITLHAAQRLHHIIDHRLTPPAIREKKCDSCSLLNLCLPDAIAPNRSVNDYLSEIANF